MDSAILDRSMALAFLASSLLLGTPAHADDLEHEDKGMMAEIHVQ